ncbi:MAG TPA: pentapeptide repeat-containing protein, partial [Saprospiraceae bacterium]|nr:pentapeptide repeat-containing protein [Saprospiraceae bacterium]
MIKITQVLLVVFFLNSFSACTEGNKSDSGGLYPEKADSTNLPELLIFLEENQIANIVNEETTLQNGKKRMRGIKPVPQDFDDFRGDSLDEVYWNKMSVIEGDFRGASIRSARCSDGNFRKSDFRAADVRWSIFNGSTMDSANYEQSRLFHVKVSYADLSNSNFRGADMFGMEGHFTKMRNCDFSGALMKDSEFLD